MNLKEIKDAVDSGCIVHWSNPGYVVERGASGAYFIRCTMNNHCIGLTWTDGVTMNGQEEDFFLGAAP